MYLKGKGIWSQIEGSEDTESSPEEGDEGALDRAQKMKNAQACSIIMGLCSPKAFCHILSIRTAKEQREKLKQVFQQPSITQLSAQKKHFAKSEPLARKRALARDKLLAKWKAFASPAPKHGEKVDNIAAQLDELQQELEVIDPKERPTDNRKTSILMGAVMELDPRLGPCISNIDTGSDEIDYRLAVAKLAEVQRQFKELDAKGASQARRVVRMAT